MEFKEFRKIQRLYRDIVITEKLDGTNACLIIGDDGSFATQSRNRIITPEDDNHGFSAWAHSHKEELIKGLGVGYHYGEWWGGSIQRGYGIKEKTFSLFNTARWGKERPACCAVVPVLYEGVFEEAQIELALDNLKEFGSLAAPKFMKPEGIIVYHKNSDQLFKVTLDGDGHKGNSR